MERHRCKLCYKKFSNGRALGGHMRSHMMNLPLVPKLDPAPPPPPQPQSQPPLQSGCETESSTQSPSLSHYSSDSEQEDQRISADHQGNEDEVDMFVQSTTTEPTWSSSLVTLQDRESETESLKKNPSRRRSKRSLSSNFRCDYTTKMTIDRRSSYSHIENEYHHQEQCEATGGGKENNRHKSVSPDSSISEVTSDTDLAYCLMMMSRDKWTTTDSSESRYKNVYGLSTSRVKKKYKCETCNKVFRSYQALGGHRASHKKFRTNENFELHGSNNFTSRVEKILELPQIEKEVEEQQQKKVHECPVCLRVFSSGQALGGHKRSHVIISGCDYVTNQDYSAPLSNVNDEESPKKMKMMMAINRSNHTTNESISLIDLNLPAPVYYGDENEEEISQIDDVHL